MSTTIPMTMISVKIEKDLKEEAARIAGELGFSLSAIIKSSLKKIVREKRVDVSLEPEYNPEFVKSVLEAEKEARAGINLSGPFETMEEIEKHLMSL